MLCLVIIPVLDLNLISPSRGILTLFTLRAVLPNPGDQLPPGQTALYQPTVERREGCGPQQVLTAQPTMALPGLQSYE